MSVGEIISIGIMCLKLAPAFLLLGIGLRYLFYDADAWNLDKSYEKYFHGRRRKKYRQFTQRVGLVLLIVGLIYTWLVVWPILEGFILEDSK
tara:strand:+ start:2875 stop:3150 length:276 start_codon:yes stop_codon:yes gene_type:complete